MEFEAGTPIWRQLVDEFIRRIVSGQWPAGSRIPAVRELATDLRVNPNTAQRALSELERRELCYTERTAGRFITEDHGRIDDLRLELARSAAINYIRTAQQIKLSLDRAQQLISESWHHHDDNKSEGS
ncbi:MULTISPECIES: GntR family transcriptional regulator [Auritidibacter]|uniref:GntR family transcriptional regulator n=1 Tax=Auritidibacter TaxID=1160973 RepID=UPI000D72AA8D|nr:MULTISPECIES: GntR family transcriptional regulator [Auritidibacter]PXA76497.1 GntR family transcriptional regulator [Auritidibacter sp. NML100628]WGH90157.1 GntR family transcriptional regulator [Auritidibacter ignavus]